MPSSGVKLPLERTVRMTAGLVMFAYAICHLISHATGLFLLNGIQRIGHDIIMVPWRTPVGLSFLLAAFLIHLGLGLWALYRRRHLRMPAIEAWQFGLGFAIPLLLAPHLGDARLGVLLYGLEDSYARVLYLFWLTDPTVNLTRQFALLIAVWIHGCIGIHMWLRLRPWYRRWLWAFVAGAIALPFLSILGVTNAGWDTILRAATEPGFTAAHGPPAPGTRHAAALVDLGGLVTRLQLAYLALVAAVFCLRGIRNLYERHSGSFKIDYSGRSITVPRGFSILEASRWARIPHASICGARGRCSTCRVRVLRGLERLPPPAAVEHITLQRIRAPLGVRLACQVRPTSDVSVAPLVPAVRPLDGLRFDLDQGREQVVTALYVDLRDSTRLAAGRLPFDAMFIVDRYIQATTAAILAHGGHVTSVAGDGIMSIFDADGDVASGARHALLAAETVWQAVDQVSEDLASEIASPLRFGIGVHNGPSVVGPIGLPDRTSLQFLGDTGNVAARLESLTKEMDCTAIVSTETLSAAEWPQPDWPCADVEIRGRDTAMSVFLISRCDQFAAFRRRPTLHPNSD